MGGREVIRYEDHAERRTGIEGWVCTRCGRYWGDDEHMARYCCSNDFPCECGARIGPGRVRCGRCSAEREARQWAEKEKAAWSGEFPVCEWRGDRYFFDEDEFAEWCADFVAEGGRVEDIRLVECREAKPRPFGMADYLHDDIGEEGADRLDFREIDKVVNDWIAANVTGIWEPTNIAIDPESFREFVEDAVAEADES